MQHSHDALDRPGGVARGRFLSPLRYRDFRVLWAGMTVSLLGDGVFLIAIAWESYSLWNTPAALSIVSIGMTVPMIAFLLFGGIVSDRNDRRVVMAWSDGIRAAAVAVLAVLVLVDALQFWELVVLVAVYGAGTAFHEGYPRDVSMELDTDADTVRRILDTFPEHAHLWTVTP